MSAFTKEHLLSCLSNQKNYKDTKLYITQAGKQNAKVISILSEVLTDVIAKNTHPPLTKMSGLRLFKDIFESAEMTCIEELDQKIENSIYRTAGYKRDSKQPNRGQTYFIQVEKKPDTPENRQLGKSYHLFALQIIKNFAQWYPKDFEGEESRFKQYYTELIKEGVAFPGTNNYVKIEDKQKFKNNFKKWVEKMNSQDKNEAPEPVMSTLQSNIARQALPIASNMQPPKEFQKPAAQTKNSSVKEGSKIQTAAQPSVIQQPPANKPNSQTGSKVKTQKQQYDQKLKQQLETSVASYQKLRTDLQAQNSKLKRNFEQRQSQLNLKLQQMKKQLQQTHQKLSDKQKQNQGQAHQQIRVYEQKNSKLEDELKLNKGQLVNKQKIIKNLQQKVRELEQVIKKKDEKEKDKSSSARPSTNDNQKISALQKQLAGQQRLKDDLNSIRKKCQELEKQRSSDQLQMRNLQKNNQQLKGRCSDLERKLQQQQVIKPEQKPLSHRQQQKSQQKPVKKDFSPELSESKYNIKKLPRNQNNVMVEHKRIRSMPKTECNATQDPRKKEHFNRQRNLFERTAPNFLHTDHGENEKLFSTSTKLSDLLNNKNPALYKRKKF